MTSRTRLLALAVLALGLAGCQRNEILSVDSESAPGVSAPTVETLLEVSTTTSWIDTVFSGYTKPSNSTFMSIINGAPEVSSRGLVLFESPVLDSIFAADTFSAAQQFDSLRLILGFDTARSVIDTSGTTVQLWSVEQGWDYSSADWVSAVDSPGVNQPWTAGPGGTLGQVLSELTLTEEPDSLVFDLTAYSDSLLNSWNDSTLVNSGLAVVVADSGHLVVGAPRLQYNIIPEVRPDTAVEVRCPTLTSLVYCVPRKTYMFDASAAPPPVGIFRVGGVNGYRSFSQVEIPETVPVAGFEREFTLRQATINRAVLILTSLGPPDPPFGSEADFSVSVVRLADDYRVLGAKTPVGELIVTSSTVLEPDSLAAGSRIQIDVTPLIQEWAALPFETEAPPLRFLVRAFPEGTTFGYWDFGAADGDPASAPILWVVFTPATEFLFP